MFEIRKCLFGFRDYEMKKRGLTNVVYSLTRVYFNPFQSIKLPSYKEITYNHEFLED